MNEVTFMYASVSYNLFVPIFLPCVLHVWCLIASLILCVCLNGVFIAIWLYVALTKTKCDPWSRVGLASSSYSNWLREQKPSETYADPLS